ncbi:MAG: hypothetical protein ABUL42_04255 [Terricaulis silvestris]
MADSVFRPGQRVSVTDMRGAPTPGGFKIINALPTEGRAPRYRVKGDLEPFERIVDASRIESSPL